MADVESTLLWKAIQGGKLEAIAGRGFRIEHFADPEVREVYEYGLEYMGEYGESPTQNVIKSEFPKFTATITKEPLKWHMRQFENQVRERKAVELVRDYMDLIEDPDEIPNIELHALDMARQLTEEIPQPRVSRLSDGKKKRVPEYDRRKKTGDIRGILLGIPSIDEIMLGIKPHELLTIAAYMGVGKSILMQYIAVMAYLQGKTSLFISLEMDEAEIWERIDVMLTQIKYQALKGLELVPEERERWESMLERAEEDKLERDIIIMDGIKNCTADHVMAEMMRYKPDIVFVDYLELMKTPRGVSSSHWERVSFSGESLKQNSRVQRIPTVTATQLNRDGGKGEVTLATVGYQSVGKHSDVVLGLSQDEELEARQQMKVLSLKIRSNKRTHATMRWELDRMNIEERGTDERFPTKTKQSMIGHDRRKHAKLSVARAVGGRDNPWGGHASKSSKDKGDKKAAGWGPKAKRRGTVSTDEPKPKRKVKVTRVTK